MELLEIILIVLIITTSANTMIIAITYKQAPLWMQEWLNKGQAILARLMGANSSLVQRGAEVIAEDLGDALPQIAMRLLPYFLQAMSKYSTEEEVQLNW